MKLLTATRTRKQYWRDFEYGDKYEPVSVREHKTWRWCIACGEKISWKTDIPGDVRTLFGAAIIVLRKKHEAQKAVKQGGTMSIYDLLYVARAARCLATK